jgi:hypothetical protein
MRHRRAPYIGLTAYWDCSPFEREDLRMPLYYVHHIHSAEETRWSDIVRACLSALLPHLSFDWVGRSSPQVHLQHDLGIPSQYRTLMMLGSWLEIWRLIMKREASEVM